MQKNKRVLVVCQHFWPESFRINDICDYLIERGCEIEVLCGIPNYPTGKFYTGYGYYKKRKQLHNGARIQRTLEIPRGSNSSIRIFLNYISYPLASLVHVPRLLLKPYDRVFIYQLSPVMMALPGILVAKLRRRESILYVLDLWPENLYSVIRVGNPILKKLAFAISNWHYKQADKLVVLSEQMKRRLMQTTGKHESNIIVLPQACEKIYEQDEYDEGLRARFKGGFNILYAGNISPAQSFDTLIKAALQLKKRGITDIRWVIVGDGMSRTNVEQDVEDAGLKDCFFFEGHKPISDIPKYNDIADLLVGCLVESNLLEATIPAKVMSYLASGKPMVLAMDGEVQKLINNIIKCGYVSKTEDAVALANNIITIYRMSIEERERLGQRAREYHFSHFERNIILNQLYNFMFSKSSVE